LIGWSRCAPYPVHSIPFLKDRIGCRNGCMREPSIAIQARLNAKLEEYNNKNIYYLINYEIYIKILSSKGIEPFTAINQFFYRESPLPIGSPALNLFYT
jgi:hypothetical protein